MSADDVERTAESTLERIKIMRVFDFVGMSEAVNELRADLEATLPHQGTVIKPHPVQPARQEIPDSEDEDDDDDMLLDWEPTQQPVERKRSIDLSSDDGDEKIGLLLVDNMYHVANPVLKSNYIQGKQVLLHVQFP
jgi:hypothetical protein